MTGDSSSTGTGDDLALAQLKAECDALRAEVAQLKEALAAKDAGGDVEKLKDLAARAQADLQNAKARLERERDELSKYAVEGLVTKLLPTLDNFQRAFDHLPESFKGHEWVAGVQATEQEVMRILGAAGLKKMSSLGQKIDPSRHEILMSGPGAADTVVEVFDEGYELQGKVVRPAKVRAGDGTAA